LNAQGCYLKGTFVVIVPTLCVGMPLGTLRVQ
jgi:hypothetical protein